MAPPQPPLPMASSLPFQPDSGSQNSALMSESVLGVRLAAIRQKAGSLSNGTAPPPGGRKVPSGSLNAPASTDLASSMWTVGVLSVCRPSHGAAWSAAGSSPAAAMIQENL